MVQIRKKVLSNGVEYIYFFDSNEPDLVATSMPVAEWEKIKKDMNIDENSPNVMKVLYEEYEKLCEESSDSYICHPGLRRL